ncbi:hypothetical protein PF001_g7680 [Phytophthora fragariae]|uniref:Uncharacterized protein n=1 Tax=Phytophthora fragariae TaxID=53985 RepID=A0A6A4E3K1_9STRA|nr:hypothetical protein PF001_g7680 [Phytophthora fragariae]
MVKHNVKTKCALLESVTRKNPNVITATGAGAKADPELLVVDGGERALPEHVLFPKGHKIELEKDEVEFVYQGIWRGHSSVSGTRNGGHGRLYLACWATDRPFHADNVVYLTTKEFAKLDKDGVEGSNQKWLPALTLI